MSAKLDRSQVYATVHGDSKVFFEQDHKQFDSMGEEIPGTDTEKPIAEGSEAAKTAAPLVVTKDASGNLFGPDGQILDMDGMETDRLRVLAKGMGLELHPATGQKKLMAAIADAAVPVDQVSQQLSQ